LTTGLVATKPVLLIVNYRTDTNSIISPGLIIKFASVRDGLIIGFLEKSRGVEWPEVTRGCGKGCPVTEGDRERFLNFQVKNAGFCAFFCKKLRAARNQDGGRA